MRDVHGRPKPSDEQGQESGSAPRHPRRSSLATFRPLQIAILRRRGLTWIALAAVLAVIASASYLLFGGGIFSPSEHVVLTLRGSTALGDELMPKLAAAFLRDEMGAVQTGIRAEVKDVKGHSRLRVWGKVPGMSGLQVIEVDAAGSGAAFECLAMDFGPKSCDIGLSSRPIDALDKQRYPALRNMGTRGTEHVLALDGIATIVNPLNPVTQLSIDQLRGIYSGQITNWKAVGGNDAGIELYGRDRDSGTFAAFTDKVMGQGGVSSAVPDDHRIGDSELMVDAVMRSPNSIGYVSHAMIRGTKALAISEGGSPAIAPTELTVLTEEYPICRQLLLYNWDTPGSVVDAFVRYAISKPGQAVVVPTPLVELPARVFPVVPPRNAPAAYRALATEFVKVGLSFHFSPGQADTTVRQDSQFDSLAGVNLLRLRAFLAQRRGTGNDILLIGFNDTQEANPHDHRLARMRAKGVAASLRAIGVFVPSENLRDFGADLPVGSNATAAGRLKNRRVEVWVRKGLQ